MLHETDQPDCSAGTPKWYMATEKRIQQWPEYLIPYWQAEGDFW